MSTFKKIAVVAVMSLALALTVSTVVSADTLTFTRSLTIGSRGTDVTALQTWLINQGYSIPAGATGYFGTQTRTAVAKWQSDNNISPAAGYFGPISRGVANGTAMTTTPGCPAGAMFNSMTGLPCSSATPGCPTGALFNSLTGAPCSTTTNPSNPVTLDGTDGSVTVSYNSFAPTSQTLKKGDMNKPIVSVKLQAVNGKVTVTRFDVHFSERPWLDFGSLTLVDSTGAVLATKTLSSASDVTEITVGSDYLVRFDNVNTAVTPGSDRILSVNANVLAASDKITGQTVYVGIEGGAIRTVNGKGYTDSVGLTSGTGSGVTSSTGNAVTLTSTGSTGTIYTRIDPSSPATAHTVVTSATQTTPNVTLGVFGLKAQNQNSTVNSLSFNINNSTNVATSTLLSNLRLQVGGQTYGANALTAGNVTFTNMNIALAADAWVSATLVADINTNQTGVNASSTLVAASIVGVDANYNAITVSGSNQTSADTVFSTTGINVTPGSPTALTNCGQSVNNGPTDTCTATMTFTVNNVSNSTVFMSKTPSIALATSSNPVTASTTLSSINIAAGPGDSTTSFAIPSNTSRTFTYTGHFGRPAGLAYEIFKITAVKFGTIDANGVADSANNQVLTASTNTASMVNYGLETLNVSY